ncbi:TIGR03503 family protein [Colwellia sp. RE-S-Sl-9]
MGSIKMRENNKPLHILYCISTLLFFLPLFVFADDDVPQVNYYDSDNVTNQIPYFDNRFRIDANIDELKLIFYRKRGSQPIILVRPDGSKLKINSLPEDGSVEWFDDRTYDLVKIKKPMAGPWQAIGQILPDSQILVVTDVVIEAEPLPEILLAGETLKVTGRLMNGDKGLSDPLFRAVINLDIDLFSSNNRQYDNFGAQPIKLGSFLDDGYDFDEKAGDGVYTGEFVLDFAPGEWLPIYHVKMPLMKRELRQKPIIVQKAPVKTSVEVSDEEGVNHVVTFDIDPTYVDPNSIILQGKVVYPDKQEIPFSLLEKESNSRIKTLEYTEAGIHRITVDVFGKTINGREFFLTLPEFTFNAENKNGLLIPSLDDEGNEIMVPRKTAAEILAEKEALEAEARAIEAARIQAEEEEQQKQMYIMIGVVNGVIIVVGICIFVFLTLRKKKAIKAQGTA